MATTAAAPTDINQVIFLKDLGHDLIQKDTG